MPLCERPHLLLLCISRPLSVPTSLVEPIAVLCCPVSIPSCPCLNTLFSPYLLVSLPCIYFTCMLTTSADLLSVISNFIYISKLLGLSLSILAYITTLTVVFGFSFDLALGVSFI
jgi:hypothetical protein